MKEWLDKQKEVEQEILDAASQQAYEVIDQLLPQIRLSAMEGGMKVKVNLEIAFDFTEGKTDLSSVGAVTFPVRVVEAQSIKIDER